MDKSRLESLKKQREALNEDYRVELIKYTEFKDVYIKTLSGIGDKIHAIDREIQILRMPVEE